MILLPLLVHMVVATQAPPKDTAWGNPLKGVRLGVSVVRKAGGPPVINCYLKNESDSLAVFCPDAKASSAVIPEYMLKGHDGVWFVRPPSSYPGLWDGPDYRMVYVPAHWTVLVNSSRFYFATSAGKYVLTASYATLRRDGPENSEKQTPVKLDSGETTIDLKPDDIQPGGAPGIG